MGHKVVLVGGPALELAPVACVRPRLSVPAPLLRLMAWVHVLVCGSPSQRLLRVQRPCWANGLLPTEQIDPILRQQCMGHKIVVVGGPTLERSAIANVRPHHAASGLWLGLRLIARVHVSIRGGSSKRLLRVQRPRWTDGLLPTEQVDPLLRQQRMGHKVCSAAGLICERALAFPRGQPLPPLPYCSIMPWVGGFELGYPLKWCSRLMHSCWFVGLGTFLWGIVGECFMGL
mmetsp:Transcript_147285/g.257338  ORF Transcript_147285/g.257338 Transcript_147285/m.257338 type:complete len:231 (+) Transcript_147285:1525-2217(+)